MVIRSVVVRTGQSWKAALAFAAIIIGGAMSFYGGFALPDPSWTILGTLVVTAGLVLAWLGIRCPNCGARWVWLAMSRHHPGQWLQWLLSQPACPNCQHPPRSGRGA